MKVIMQNQTHQIWEGLRGEECGHVTKRCPPQATMVLTSIEKLVP
jgi:hypothetical protein